MAFFFCSSVFFLPPRRLGSHSRPRYVQKGNPAVRNRRKRPRQANQLTSTDLNVVDAANGLGQANQSKAELNLEIETFGVIGENKLYDGAKTATVQIGGLQTIKNSGPYDINPGNWIVVEAPDPNNPKVVSFTDMPKEKILFQTVPYDPTRVAPSLKLLSLMLVDGKATQMQREDLKKNQAYADDFSKAFSVGLRAIGFAGVLSALQSGIVSMTAGGEEAQNAAAAAFCGERGKAFRVQIGKAFDLAKRLPEEHNLWLIDDPSSKTGEQIGVAQYMTRMLLLGRSFAPVFQALKSNATGALVYNNSDESTITEAVTDAVADMLASFRQMDYEEKRRIIGRAMSCAAPGQDLDVYLGSYIA